MWWPPPPPHPSTIGAQRCPGRRRAAAAVAAAAQTYSVPIQYNVSILLQFYLYIRTKKKTVNNRMSSQDLRKWSSTNNLLINYKTIITSTKNLDPAECTLRSVRLPICLSVFLEKSVCGSISLLKFYTCTSILLLWSILRNRFWISFFVSFFYFLLSEVSESDRSISVSSRTARKKQQSQSAHRHARTHKQVGKVGKMMIRW